MNRSQPLYGMMAEFASAAELLLATRLAVQKGYRQLDAYTPHPVDGLDEALHFRPRLLPWLALLGGIGAGAGGYFMQYYACARDYPLLVAGRALHSWPAFIPITFELTILGAALAAAFGMVVLNHLPEPYHPVFNVESFARASQDRFFLCIEANDPQFEQHETQFFLQSLHPIAVHAVSD